MKSEELVKEFGYDTKTIELAQLLQEMNKMIIDIRGEELRLKKLLKALKASREELDRRYNDILGYKYEN